MATGDPPPTSITVTGGGFDEIFEPDSGYVEVDLPTPGVEGLRVTLYGSVHGGLPRRLHVLVRGDEPVLGGSYDLSHFDLHDPDATGVLVWYGPATAAAWTSVRGRLEVTEASDARFAGRLQAEAHNCSPSRIACGDGDPISISGSFSVERGAPDRDTGP